MKKTLITVLLAALASALFAPLVFAAKSPPSCDAIPGLCDPRPDPTPRCPDGAPECPAPPPEV